MSKLDALDALPITYHPDAEKILDTYSEQAFPQLVDSLNLIAGSHPGTALDLSVARPDGRPACLSLSVANHRYLVDIVGCIERHEVFDGETGVPAPTIDVPVQWTVTEIHHGVMKVDATLFGDRATATTPHLIRVAKAHELDYPLSEDSYVGEPDGYDMAETLRLLPSDAFTSGRYDGDCYGCGQRVPSTWDHRPHVCQECLNATETTK